VTPIIPALQRWLYALRASQLDPAPKWHVV
jgi:hypothetical protein